MGPTLKDIEKVFKEIQVSESEFIIKNDLIYFLGVYIEILSKNYFFYFY